MDLIFVVPEREPHPITGLVAHRFECGRRYSEYYLFYPSLRGSPAEGVEIKRNRKGTAWIVLPNGHWKLIVLQGHYMTKGRWATEYKGLYVSQLLAPQEVQVLTNMTWRSRGGGLGASLLVLAVPKDIDPRTPLARVLVTESWEQEGSRLVLADGSLVEDVPVDDWEIGPSLDQLLSEKRRELEALEESIEAKQKLKAELDETLVSLKQEEREALQRLLPLRREERELEEKVRELKLTAESEKLIRQLKRLWFNLRAGAPTVILREVLHEMFKEVDL